MASSARIDEIKKKFDENPRRYFAPLANEFRKAGDLEQAIIICEEFLPQQAGHMSGHIVYGQALYESGRLPESRTVFETALALDPENLIALRHLGDIARSQGEFDAARQWYDRVLEADPRNEEIQGVLSALAAEMGEPIAPRRTEAGSPLGAPASRDDAPVPELAAIELDMDADFGLPAGPPTPAAPASPAASLAAPPTREEPPFESLSLEGLEPTNAEAATAASMPEVRDVRAEGLEPSEFEAPAMPTERAAGLEAAEFEAPTAPAARAEGLQSAEFEAPDSSVAGESLLDLDTTFSSAAPSSGAGVTAGELDGLEPTGATQPLPAPTSFPSLDFDDASPAADSPGPGLGTAAAPAAANPHLEPPAAMEAMPALEMGPDDFAATGSDPAGQAERAMEGLPMMELTPAVIAAESKLMDAGVSYEPGAGESREDAAVPAPPPFVTETMAELYLKQGFREQALDVYRQLASAAPGDARLQARLAGLEQEGIAETATAGPSVREFFFRLATRRPGERGAEGVLPDGGHFASFDGAAVDSAAPGAPAPHAEPVSPAPAAALADATEWELAGEAEAASAPVGQASGSGGDGLPDLDPLPSVEMPTRAFDGDTRASGAESTPAEADEPAAIASGAVPSATERGATAQGGMPAGGTIDALFGTRPNARSEDSAASALAQAFGGTSDAPAIVGRPARAAAQELSLDSVFRDGPARPPRASQSFSFDQFFSESATADAASAPAPDGASGSGPAERSADDIQQFNSWLQGLKQR